MGGSDRHEREAARQDDGQQHGNQRGDLTQVMDHPLRMAVERVSGELFRIV